MYVYSITYLRTKTNMNQGKSDIIAKRKVQALYTNKNTKYDNRKIKHINDITITGKGVRLIRVKAVLEPRAGHFRYHLFSTFSINVILDSVTPFIYR